MNALLLSFAESVFNVYCVLFLKAGDSAGMGELTLIHASQRVSWIHAYRFSPFRKLGKISKCEHEQCRSTQVFLRPIRGEARRWSHASSKARIDTT